MTCVKSLLCVQNCLSGVWWNKLGEWSLPNINYALERATVVWPLNGDQRQHYICTTFTPERCKADTPSLSRAQCYVSLPEEQEQKEESSNSSTFINLLAINEQLVREMSAIVFFLKKKKKKKEIQLDYMGLPGMYNRREPQCKSSAGNRTQFIFGNT